MHPRWIDIEGLRVDVSALASLTYACRPGRCAGASCCARYEVCVATEELGRLVGLLPAAARYAVALRGPDGLDNPFEPLGGGLWAIDTDEDGLCVLAYRDRSGATRCSLHSAALEAGLDPLAHKPLSCALWPVAVSEDDPPVLTVADDATELPCCRPRRSLPTRLDEGLAGNLLVQFGRGVVEGINEALARGAGETRGADRVGRRGGET